MDGEFLWELTLALSSVHSVVFLFLALEAFTLFAGVVY